ncbi:MAG: hypothetical protein FWE09_06175, partial [Treponema sp.]|nr:hypothetical protein [Treponema sp.]
RRKNGPSCASSSLPATPFMWAFFADAWEGEARSSAEADPFWRDLNDIPWDEMWEDDRHWLPQALAGKKLRGCYVFDGDKMLSQETAEVVGFD